MQVQIFDRNITLSDDQTDYIREKIFALKDYGHEVDDESTVVRVDVESNKMKTSNKNITVQVTMFIPHAVIRSEVYATTVEEGLDLSVGKLKKQLERYKGKRHRRDKSGKWIPSSTLEEISATTGVTEEVSQISKRKSMVELEPMHEEEAIEQLELLGHSFYAFINSENGRFDVVYRRDDGSYGLLDFAQKQ
ncbi:ribosome-associated translation inhibitor RaiA [Candidatus Peregrinibacteria bacterium]|nr:ribosome-associated translation inhibitor RaiA [Candidatus Peregrinibacteria bacterium]